jgi:hypothetical protein
MAAFTFPIPVMSLFLSLKTFPASESKAKTKGYLQEQIDDRY